MKPPQAEVPLLPQVGFERGDQGTTEILELLRSAEYRPPVQKEAPGIDLLYISEQTIEPLDKPNDIEPEQPMSKLASVLQPGLSFPKPLEGYPF